MDSQSLSLLQGEGHALGSEVISCPRWRQFMIFAVSHLEPLWVPEVVDPRDEGGGHVCAPRARQAWGAGGGGVGVLGRR